MGAVTSPDHRLAATRMREVLAIYEKNKDLILIGAYEKGSDSRVDHAIRMLDRAREFLKQETHEKVSIGQAVEALQNLFTNA